MEVNNFNDGNQEISDQIETKITAEKLIQWRDESLKTAEQLGYNLDLLEYIKENVQLTVIDSSELTDVWYGICYFDEKIIGVLKNNITTQPFDNILQEVVKLGAPLELITVSKEIVRDVGLNNFAEITNQSGMDHEIIGHMYHFLSGESHDENAAVKTQIQMANFRAEKDQNWEKVTKVMPKILGYHKSIDSFK